MSPTPPEPARGLCVHGKPLHKPELCPKCWELAWALGLVETRTPQSDV